MFFLDSLLVFHSRPLWTNAAPYQDKKEAAVLTKEWDIFKYSKCLNVYILKYELICIAILIISTTILSVCKIVPGNGQGFVLEEESHTSGCSPLLPHGFWRCVPVCLQALHGGHNTGSQFHQPEEEVPSLLIRVLPGSSVAYLYKVTEGLFREDVHTLLHS